mgnify:FL=1
MAAFAQALYELGFHVELTSVSRFCISCYLDWFGIDLTRFKVHVLPIKLKLGIYLRPMSWLPVALSIPHLKPDFILMDFCQSKPIVMLKKYYKFKSGEYIHYPCELIYGENNWRSNPYFMEKYVKFPWNLYFKGSIWLEKEFNRGNPFEVNDIVWANSRWTAEIAKQVYGELPRILNPPIPLNVEVIKDPKPFEERESRIVMIGRFGFEKRYHWVISELMTHLIKEIPDITLTIIGGTGTVSSERYYQEIINLSKKQGIKVELYKNAPNKLKINLIDRSRVFLHATINEHWGIAVAEAMARGLPVVVHKSGGTWSDIVAYGEYGFGYESIDEAVESLARLLTDSRIWRYYSMKGLRRISDLTFDKFIDKIRNELKLIGL